MAHYSTRRICSHSTHCGMLVNLPGKNWMSYVGVRGDKDQRLAGKVNELGTEGADARGDTGSMGCFGRWGQGSIDRESSLSTSSLFFSSVCPLVQALPSVQGKFQHFSSAVTNSF